MSLGSPPPRGVLRKLPARRLAGMTLHRVHATSRNMWWFSSSDPTRPRGGGRFDLRRPNGSCYLATAVATAVLEALQDFSGGLVPASALRARSISDVTVPSGAPSAANLTARVSAGAGVGVALWADGDRALTQQWAEELHGAGWQALYHGASHEPTGRGRSVTLFDKTGTHVAWGDRWDAPGVEPLLSSATIEVLAAHGISVSDLRPHLDLRADWR